MDKELLEQFQMIVQGMADMEARLSENIKAEIQKAETRINIKIENDVTKRIDALFDGYKLTHETMGAGTRDRGAQGIGRRSSNTPCCLGKQNSVMSTSRHPSGWRLDSCKQGRGESGRSCCMRRFGRP